ncbi:hypothetical protein ACTWPT_47215 [Nonomuraea sp. 3N208]|uniref:hypothetical protein n=1 Tax=Nonomuraea sp. 3N208 TaxID=3457421 RepID=UPI003FD61282
MFDTPPVNLQVSEYRMLKVSCPGCRRVVQAATPPGMAGPCSYGPNFSQALDEVIDSRVWGGVHFRTADVQGARLGKEVARWEPANYFKSVSR